MSRADVERLMREKPQVAFRFVEALGDRVTQLESSLEEIAFKSIPARLASLLLRLDKEQGQHNAVKGYTHQDLGEMLGTYRETITQTLNDFKSEGLIEIGRKHVSLLELESLESLSES
jgi:CRP-like cAMP-binding protein